MGCSNTWTFLEKGRSAYATELAIRLDFWTVWRAREPESVMRFDVALENASEYDMIRMLRNGGWRWELLGQWQGGATCIVF